MKGTREAPPFHKPLDAKGLLRKRSPFTSHWRAADKGKLVVIAHLSLTMPVTGASLEALGRVLCQYSALGARTGRALQNGLHAGRKQSIGHPFSSHQKFGRAMLPDNESRDGEFHKLFRLATDKKAADHEGCSYSMSRASSSHH